MPSIMVPPSAQQRSDQLPFADMRKRAGMQTLTAEFFCIAEIFSMQLLIWFFGMLQCVPPKMKHFVCVDF